MLPVSYKCKTFFHTVEPSPKLDQEPDMLVTQLMFLWHHKPTHSGKPTTEHHQNKATLIIIQFLFVRVGMGSL